MKLNLSIWPALLGATVIIGGSIATQHDWSLERFVHEDIPPTPLVSVVQAGGPPVGAPGLTGYGATATTSCDRSDVQVIWVTSTVDGDATSGSWDWAMDQVRPDSLDIILFAAGGAYQGTTQEGESDCYIVHGGAGRDSGQVRKRGRFVPHGNDDEFVVSSFTIDPDSSTIITLLTLTSNRNAAVINVSARGSTSDGVEMFLDTGTAAADTARDITFAWNLIGPQPTPGLGLMMKGWDGSGDESFKLSRRCDAHHNLMIGINTRTPNMGCWDSKAVNNYAHGQVNRQMESNGDSTSVDFINNYVSVSPMGRGDKGPIWVNDATDTQSVYLSGNAWDSALTPTSQWELVFSRNTTVAVGADSVEYKRSTPLADATYPISPVWSAADSTLYDSLLVENPSPSRRWALGDWYGVACDGQRELRRSTNDSTFIAEVRADGGDASQPDSVAGWSSYTDPVDVAGSQCTDTDGDDLPDAFENRYWGTLTAQDATGDPDGDGWTNIEEYIWVTNPTLATDASGDDAASAATYNDTIRVHTAPVTSGTHPVFGTYNTWSTDSIPEGGSGRYCIDSDASPTRVAFITLDTLSGVTPVSATYADSLFGAWARPGCDTASVKNDPIP